MDIVNDVPKKVDIQIIDALKLQGQVKVCETSVKHKSPRHIFK